MQAGSSRLVAQVLDMFALGLLPFSAFLLLLRAYYARQDTKTPLVVNLVSNAAYLVFSLSLFPGFDVRGLALAHTLCYVVAAGLAAVLLSRRIGGLEWKETSAALAKVTGASAVAAAAMLAVLWGVSSVVAGGDGRALLQLALGGTAGLVAFVVTARAARLEDLGLFSRLLPAAVRSRVGLNDRGGGGSPGLS
jgi:putative peptidoglycan lipid II flippase